MEVLILFATFATTVCFVLAAFTPRRGVVRERLRAYQFTPVAGGNQLALPFSQRIIYPAGRRMGSIIAGLAPKQIQEQTATQMEMAGSPVSASTFLAVRVLLMVGLFAFYLPVMFSGQERSLVQLASFVLTFYLLSRLPKTWINLKISDRQKRILHRLPDALDLITVCMEAGLAFDAALAKVVEKTRGPLRDEFGRVLQEVSLGKLRREALRDMSQRTGVPDLTSFVAAIVQADQMGLSMAGVMRAQADEMRVKRRQRAEETAMKAPVKILFPLIVCIFPAMMVVTLGPAIMAIYTNIIQRLSQL